MKVLVAFQDSPEGRAALDHGIAEASRSGGGLIVVGFIPAPTGEFVIRQYEKDRAEALEALEARVAAAAPHREVVAEVPVGAMKPSQAIVRAARQHAVDLIVIGIQRTSRIGMLGSTVQDVLLAADPPVLVVKPDGSAA